MAKHPVVHEIANLILRALPQKTVDELIPHLTAVDLPRRHVICRPDAPVEYVYFVNRGLVSIIRTMSDGRMVKIGAIGVEGLADLSAVLGFKRAVLEMIVQVPGEALRLNRGALQDAMNRCEATRNLLQQYGQWLIGQIAQTAACNRLHTLEERCCRWLLIAQDSARSDTFALTHEFFALMLGAQRSSVSIITAGLRKAGVIDYRSGKVTIVERAGLEHAACECYATLRGQLDGLFARQIQPMMSIRDDAAISRYFFENMSATRQTRLCPSGE